MAERVGVIPSRAILIRLGRCGAAAILLMLTVTSEGQAASRSEAAVLAALALNPHPTQVGSPMQRWMGEVDVRYYGSCELRDSTDEPRIAALSKLVDEINAIDSDLALALSVSDCDTDDIGPRSKESFGVAIIVGGGFQRLMQLLDMGQWGDGSELVQLDVRRQGEQVVSIGCVSNIGIAAGSGRILAGIVYVDPAVMGTKTVLCLKTALLWSFGFSGQDMAPYPDSLLAFVQDAPALPDLDRCLIATLYAPSLAGQRLDPELFRRRIPELTSKSRSCR